MEDKGMLGRVLIAAVLAAVTGASVAAQTYNAIDSGGPLWWYPENDSSYPRHHDRWYMSMFEAVNGDWGLATSFPDVSSDEVWFAVVSGAPENSACDRQNQTLRVNVGPPYPDDGVAPPRTVRTPSGAGGFAGLQMSLQIGEWWQGMKYRGYYEDATARAYHFGGVRARYDPALFGWFDVTTRDGAGVEQRPPLYDGGHSVTWINPAYSQWQLWGGGGFAMPCLGTSMVHMHGVDGGGRDKVWPPTPVGADGGECWSNARPLVLRANSEARCEPNLAERYAYTVRFRAIFDAAPPRPIPPPPWLVAGSYTPLFPPDYAAPYLMARRGEIALFTVSELAQASPPPVPWSPVSYPDPGVEIGTTRGAMPPRFLDPNRVDPFGGASYGQGTIELPLQDNPSASARECIELGEPGWDAATGTLRVDCGHGRENSPMTGNVNRAVMGYGAVERSREVGPMDNSRGYGGRALARRTAGLWAPPSGFGWFEHRSATLGCLFLEADVDMGLIAAAYAARDAWWARVPDEYGAWSEGRLDYRACPSNTRSDPDRGDACRAAAAHRMALARARAIRYFRYGYGWEVIGDYRSAVLPELASALSGAGYRAPRTVLRALGRWGGTPVRDRCGTSVSGGAYNEALIASVPTMLPGVGYGHGQSSIPGQGGRMWYGPGFEAYGAHLAGEQGDLYGQRADVAGRTTDYSEAVINPGSDYPEELRRYADYNNVRLGSTVWRDFACKTSHGGYYGMGLTALGTSRFDHREFPNDAWRNPDPGVVLGDTVPTQFSSGTPCTGNAAYDALGADGTRRCFPQSGLGAYSTSSGSSGDAGFFMLEYSGDGSSDTGRSGSVGAMRPTSYRMLPGSEALVLFLRSSFFDLEFGYRSLDVERQAIWSGYGAWGNSYRSSWLATAEAFEGLAPGWCSGPSAGGCDVTQVPMDYGRLEHQGQLSWYGAMVPGGTGGCTVNHRTGTGVQGKPPEGSVIAEDQQIFCLLPLDVGPDGRCPGENLP